LFTFVALSMARHADCPRSRRRRILSLFAWRSEARAEFEVKDTRSAPPSMAAFQAVLEFEFRSRRIASKQSMKIWRRGRRARPARIPHRGFSRADANPSPVRERGRGEGQPRESLAEKARLAARPSSSAKARRLRRASSDALWRHLPPNGGRESPVTSLAACRGRWGS
jgi:hypothetical protein